MWVALCALGLAAGLLAPAPVTAAEPFDAPRAAPKEPRAAPKEPRVALRVLRAPRDGGDQTAVAVVDLGGRFVLGGGPWGTLVELSPGIAAQFDLQAPSMELVNADYRVGLGITRVRGAWSGRLELYHQSSHLGDEFLLRKDPVRENVNFEAVEALLAYRMGAWHLYGGADARVRGAPDALPRRQWLAGLEWRPQVGVATRPYVAWYGSREHGGGQRGDSFALGFEFAAQGVRRHAIRAALVRYQGHSPFGQFFTQRIQYTGVLLELVL
ncbi:DUF1207 domain-containing protein [Ectothiorhodospiraceae bacterium 2226]|nr:DUF1207 domain-containing protein [Ectothiorhodospiraceae bacterium 2226]